MSRKLKKLCALILSTVTVLTLLPSSGLVNADVNSEVTTKESVQSTVYLKVPNPSGQVIITSKVGTDDETTQVITVDDEKTTLRDTNGNTSDVTLTEEGYCLELTEEVGETINLELVASDGYEVGTYHILTDTGDEIKNNTLSNNKNKYEYTFSSETQILEVIFTSIEKSETNNKNQSNSNAEDDKTTDDKTTNEKISSDELSIEERFALAEKLGVSEWVTDEGYLSEDYYINKKSFKEMFLSGVTPLLKTMTEEELMLWDMGVSLYKVESSQLVSYDPPPDEYQDNDPTTVGLFKVNGHTAFCAQHHIATPEKNSPTGTPKLVTNNNIRKVLYYGYKGVSPYKGGYTTNQFIVITSMALSYYYSGEDSLGFRVDGTYSKALEMNKFMNYIKSKLAPPSSFKAYVVTTNKGSTQDLMYYEYNPTGSGYIVKSSSNTSLTSGNSNYNLTGATYNIYKTKSNAQNNKNAISGKQFKIASNSGKSNTVTLDAGTYYIKEVSGADGTGYTTSSTVYTIKITAGKTNVNLTPSGGIKNTPKTVTINLNKVSSNPTCVENNENYSLEGAVYGIYTNSACTTLKTKATTNADGEFSVTNLPLGQYWVKEITPSPGYQLDTKVYAVDARKEGSGASRSFTVTSTEVPLYDPVGILLKKVDSNTGDDVEDQGTLEGAQFEVKFYGADIEGIANNTDPATLGYKPLKTWVLKTDSDGFLYFDNAYKVSGDDFIYDNGVAVLPFGFLTFKEIKSPDGYLLNDDLIVVKLGSDTTISPVYQEPTQKENSLTLKLVKTQYNTDKVVPGATFKWTRPDGTTNTYTTDKNGAIEFHGLTWGKHTIEEIEVPDGYAVNTNKIEFTVAQDNTITFDKEYPMSDTNGVITLSLDSEGNMDVDYTNKPAPFDLKIHKINNHDFPLENAEFTLYSDEKCTQVIDVQVTDPKGELTFEDLIPYKNYWMKETDAPPGYRIPVNDDGSDIVWKVNVESVPVNNEFTFYVNDTAYDTSSEGSIWVDGTKADRVCNITVVNEVGMKLPNTGSSMMIILILAGVILMGGAIVVSRKSNKTTTINKK